MWSRILATLPCHLIRKLSENSDLSAFSEIWIGCWYSVFRILISTDWRIWTRPHVMTCLGGLKLWHAFWRGLSGLRPRPHNLNPHCGLTKWWRPRPSIGQRAVEHAGWHSMVGNSLKYDDLPTALEAGVVMPSPGGADILENPSFYGTFWRTHTLRRVHFYILSSVADLDCVAENRAIRRTAPVLQIFRDRLLASKA